MSEFYRKVDTQMNSIARSFEELQLLHHCGVTNIISTLYIPVKIEYAGTFHDLFMWMLNYEIKRCMSAGIKCHVALGIHPAMVPQNSKVLDDALDILEDIIKGNKTKIIAIGEVGIDTTKSMGGANQFIALKRQLEIARKYSLPVILKTPRENKRDLTKVMLSELNKNKIRRALFTHVTSENVKEILSEPTATIKVALSTQKGKNNLSINDAVTLYKNNSYENRFTLSGALSYGPSDLLYMIKTIETFESLKMPSRIIRKLCFDNAVDLFGAALSGRVSLV
ncbi:MAG: TatD family hydrolase [Promethearchaeota archaeon]